MAGKKRKVPGINGASSADIAFMLLLFFLLTTSMDTDQGLARQLPKPPEKENPEDDIKIKERNVLKVMVSSDNRIMCAGEVVSLPQLREKTIEFIDNPNNDENLPEKSAHDIPYFGNSLITYDHIISLQCDRGTDYQVYIDVQNELAAAYNVLRDNISRKQFNIKYNELDEEQKKAVATYYKQKISEAEPKQYGEQKQKRR